MQHALNTGSVDHGGFVVGHRGADWYSRARSSEILNDGTDGTSDPNSIGEMIYDYEVKIRTARKLLNASIEDNISLADSYLRNGVENDIVKELKENAENEIQSELKEYIIRSPIVSVAAGVVTGADYNCYSGFHAAVRHTVEGETPVKTSYVHMRRWPNVQAGDIVGPGTIVGYEGTTGNSTGYHLHQNMNHDGDNGDKSDSPAKYMAPIFTPFYNRDKVFETLGTIKNEWGGNYELIMGTEYMELIRTVLMYPTKSGDFDFSDKWYFDKNKNMNTGEEDLTFLLSCTVMRSGEYEYLNYASGDNVKSKVNIPGGSFTAVIKEGSFANPIYYKCQVEPDIVKVTVGSGDNLKEVDEYILRIVSGKEKYVFEDLTIKEDVAVRVDIGKDEYRPIIWGNNVPHTPLVDDVSKIVDITVMNTLKRFDPWSEGFAAEVTRPANNPTEADPLNNIAANPIVFTPDSGRLSLPDWLLLYLTDVESPYSVPMYDGPITKAMSTNTESRYKFSTAYDSGFRGSMSGDLIALKKAIKARGLVSGDELDVDSPLYDDEFIAVWEKVRNTPGYGDLKSAMCADIAYGELGHFTAGDDGDQAGEHFSNWGVCIWNTIVTYGNVANAQRAGRAAATLGATQMGIRESWVHAVANHESNFVPTAESMNFCPGTHSSQASAEQKATIRQKLSYLKYKSYPNEEKNLDKADGIIEYKGSERTLIRAFGLMQLAPPYCLNWAVNNGATNIDQIIALLRSPRSNATIGAMLLSQNVTTIISNPTLYNELKAHVDSNKDTFEALCEGTGISHYEMALIGCATCMYNRGDGAKDTVIDDMAIIEYNAGKVTGGSAKGYWRDVMAEVAAAER